MGSNIRRKERRKIIKERILDKDEAKRQNEWAKDNTKVEDRMICLVCKRMVDQHWMVIDLEKKVGGRCAPCYFESIRYK